MRLTIALALLTVLGCATPYQAQGVRGGFKEVQIARDRFYLEVKGNGFTDRVTLMGYFHKRAAELCDKIGYGSYESNEAAETHTSPSPSTYSADTTYSGNRAHTTVNESPGFQVTRHGISGTVHCTDGDA